MLLRIPLLLLTPVSFGLAQDTQIASTLIQFPACAQNCLVPSILQSPCGFTNLTCICTNAELQRNITTCVLQKCSLKDALSTKNLSSMMCDEPIRNRGNTLRILNIVLTCIVDSICLTRILYNRLYADHKHGWDDYLFMLSMAVGVTSVALIDRGLIVNGLGRDIWTLTFDEITRFAQTMYILISLYVVQLVLIKVSLLLFFLRIFPSERTQRVLKATIIFNVAWGFTFLMVGIFQCHPISNAWTAWDEPDPRHNCANLNVAVWVHAGISIVIDFWMLAIPLYEVCQLRLSLQKKINIIIMFFFGGFATIISILRLRYILYFATAQNQTWQQLDITLWSNIELNIGLLCACLPALRCMLKRISNAISPPKTTATPVMRQRSPEVESNTAHKRGRDTVLLETLNDETSLVDTMGPGFDFGFQKASSSRSSVIV